METPSQGTGGSIRLERVLAAPVEDVFAAWTEPVTMSRWLSPTGRAEVSADVRVGGQLRVTMLGEGVAIEHSGEYLAVRPPRLLSFTWRSAYTGDQPSVVTVELTPLGPTSTQLVLVHEQLPEDAAESHGSGWTAIVDQLTAVLTGSHDVPPDGPRGEPHGR
jgi:uncharacterized protein YndB with AHSA1/START domain